MNIGIVGCGLIAHIHVKSLQNIFDGENLSFCYCDIKEEKLKEFCRVFKNGNTYTEFEEMLKKEKIDVLHICTPHRLHVPMAVMALEKNINVLMEKPPAITKEQLEMLLNAKENSSAQLGICFQNRYNANTIRMKELIESGIYGEILGARAFVTWCRGKEYYTGSDWRGTWETEGGGVLINQSIHTLDLLNYFLGKPESVMGTIKNHHLKGVIQVEDTAEAYIKYSDVTACYYATNAHCIDSPVLIEIALEKIVLRIEGNNLFYIQNGNQIKKEEFEITDYKGMPTKDYWGFSHQLLIKDFYEKISENQLFPVGLEGCQETIKLVWGIYESSKKGWEVPLSGLEKRE